MKQSLRFLRNFVAMNRFSLSISTMVSRIPQASFLLVLCFTLLFGRTGYAQQTATMTCGQIDSINFGQLLEGDSVVFGLTLINHRTDQSWNVLSGISSIFKDTASSGSTLLDSSWKTGVLLNARTLSDTGSIEALDTITDSCNTPLLFEAYIIGPTADNGTFPLQSSSPEVIAIQSNSNSTSRLFYFKNESSSLDTIDSVYISGTTAFSIDSPYTFPIILNPESSFPVGLSYSRSSQGSDNGELFVVSVPDEPILQDVALQGVRTGNDAVETQPLGTIYFYLFPNPSNGLVTIHIENINAAHVTITDVLGRVEQQADFTGDWIWDRAEGTGYVPAGTYFIVVTGIGLNGEMVHEVQRLVLQ
jgi:hypothetical protein